MLALIAFCLLFLVSATAASGTAKLTLMLIEPGELLGSWQKLLKQIEPQKGVKGYFIREFWYKRLGGCVVCTRQFVAELSFIIFYVMYSIYGTFPTAYLDNILLKWLLNVVLFIAYCGTTLQIGQWLEYKRYRTNEPENIIETRYRNNNNN
jgi:hypothetical protein